MYLRPVYLLAPEPPRRSRRAFLAWSASFAVGGAIGYVLGAKTKPAQDAHAATTSASNDPQVVWARGLASDAAPLADLLRHGGVFLAILKTRAPDDRLLWQGARRLALALLDPGVVVERSTRQRLAASLCDDLRNGSPPADLGFDALREPLQELAR
jgi:hypothetical protein